MAWWQWSKTAGNNATADSTINWAEGQSPSSVNDSARAMMARLAEYRDDSSGLLTLGGTSTAYTVSTNQGLSSTPNNGQMIAVTPAATNGVGVTLQADSGNTYPIQTSAGTAISAGVMLNGTPYVLVFNSSQGAWILRGFQGNPYNIPLGGLLLHTVNTAPNSNFAFANGQAISRTTYASYFNAVGTTYGSGDGVSTYNILDAMATTIIGLDGMGGAGASQRVNVAGGNFNATVLAARGGRQALDIAQNQLPNVVPSASFSGSTQDMNLVFSGAGIRLLTSGSGAFSTADSGAQNVGESNFPANYTPSGSVTVGSINGGVTQQTTPTVQPSIALPIFVRIF